MRQGRSGDKGCITSTVTTVERQSFILLVNPGSPSKRVTPMAPFHATAEAVGVYVYINCSYLYFRPMEWGRALIPCIPCILAGASGEGG